MSERSVPPPARSPAPPPSQRVRITRALAAGLVLWTLSAWVLEQAPPRAGENNVTMKKKKAASLEAAISNLRDSSIVLIGARPPAAFFAS